MGYADGSGRVVLERRIAVWGTLRAVREPFDPLERPTGMASAYHCARSGMAGVVLACSIGVSGCGSDDQPPAATQPTETVLAVQPTTATDAPIEIVGLYESIKFYPACGNETLRHQDVTWYPIVHSGFDPTDPDLQGRIDAIFAVERVDSPVVGVRGLARVVAPGPGDDIGTLVVWADGVARWVSESRDLDVWMIDDEIIYTWVC